MSRRSPDPGRRPGSGLNVLRALDLERLWLEQGVEQATYISPGASATSGSYVDAVQARLEAHGPYVVPGGRSRARLLEDLHGLAVDLGAVSVLGAQHPQTHKLQPTLLEVVALGAAAAHLTNRGPSR